jgi:hypothetical protein
MAVAWPAQIQDCLEEQGFGLQKGETALRTDMDVGPQKVRRRFTKGVDTITGTIVVNKDQYVIFDAFFSTSLAGGILAFTFPHPITKVLTNFRFKGPYQLNPAGGGYFNISMVWEKLP